MSGVVIIGNGISGVTTARHIRKHSSKPITIISGETDYFFSRTALMYVFMGHMKMEHTQPYENHFWKKNNIRLVKAWVQEVDFEGKQVLFSNGDRLSYDQLVLATGSKTNTFGWPGLDSKGVLGLYSFQDLQELESLATQEPKGAVIVGGGLIGIEMAEMLLSRKIPVTLLVREKSYWSGVLPPEESQLVTRHIQKHHLRLMLQSSLRSIESDSDGRVKSIIVEETGEEIPCNIVGITTGVKPNIDFLLDSELELGKGILVDGFLRTNIPDVFACGDCAEFRNPRPARRPIEQVWYTGRMMGEVLAQTIVGNPTEYLPGPWFNSAKFFDLEYQTYGTVLSQLQPCQDQFYWENTEKELGFKAVFEAKNRKLIGVNCFGMRMRHPVFDRWLREGKTIEFVMEHLMDAHFDPEFFRVYQGEIVEAFNRDQGTQVQLKRKSWKRILSWTKA